MMKTTVEVKLYDEFVHCEFTDDDGVVHRVCLSRSEAAETVVKLLDELEADDVLRAHARSWARDDESIDLFPMR